MKCACACQCYLALLWPATDHNVRASTCIYMYPIKLSFVLRCGDGEPFDRTTIAVDLSVEWHDCSVQFFALAESLQMSPSESPCRCQQRDSPIDTDKSFVFDNKTGPSHDNVADVDELSTAVVVSSRPLSKEKDFPSVFGRV